MTVRLRPVAVVHQEGIVALLAIAGLGLRDGAPLAGLAPRGPAGTGIAAGVAAGLAAAAVLAALERIGAPGLRALVRWQRRLIAGWSAADRAAVAVAAGLAEEAFFRALLVPWIGPVPAAAAFAVLHVPPSRRAWVWPVVAFALGIAFGALFTRWGYPAAAAAHVALDLAGMERLGRTAPRDDSRV